MNVQIIAEKKLGSSMLGSEKTVTPLEYGAHALRTAPQIERFRHGEFAHKNRMVHEISL